MNTSEIERLMKAFEESSLTEMDIEEGNLKLHFSKNASKNTPPKKEIDDGLVCSDMVGVVYLAPYENGEPFVREGSEVREGDALCIIEAMKVMTEFPSPVHGRVTEILAANGEKVEYGQPLFRIREEGGK